MDTTIEKEYPFIIELWSGGNFDHASLLHLAQGKELQERTEMCQFLGLEKQREIIQIPPYQPFLAKDLHIWQSFLPTRFSKNGLLNRPLWANYDFDCIPTVALRAIIKAQELKCFSDLQIWIPRQQITDPLAVGLLGGLTYPIARWGESLLPFKEIIETVCLSRSNNRLLKKSKKLRELFIQFVYENPGRSFFLFMGLPRISRFLGLHRNHQYLTISADSPSETIHLCECDTLP